MAFWVRLFCSTHHIRLWVLGWEEAAILEVVQPRLVHDWDVTPAEAIAIQRRLAPQVVRWGTLEHVRFIAGTDVSAGRRDGEGGRAAVVVLRWPDLEPVEQVVVQARIRFPYVPGLLSFREIPLLLPCFARLRTRPELVIVDGQGIAHPRRLGLASHLGLVLDLPTIGCAKSRLSGQPAGDLADERGARVPLRDQGETIGYALRTRTGTNPVYVSIGHRIGLDEAVHWVLACATRSRIPEPTRLAHLAAAGRQVAPMVESDNEAGT